MKRLTWLVLILFSPFCFSQPAVDQDSARLQAINDACADNNVTITSSPYTVNSTGNGSWWQSYNCDYIVEPTPTPTPVVCPTFPPTPTPCPQCEVCPTPTPPPPTATPTPTPPPVTPTPTPPPVACVNTNVIAQYGVTWTLSGTECTGQFVTGDYWVLDDGSGVTVSSVFPANTGGRNGSVVNPVVYSALGGQHPFDDRVRAGYSSALNATYPLTLNAGDALLSTVSRPEDLTDTDLFGTNPDSKSMVKSMAVLTVVSSIPSADAFRPAYVDRSQTLYYESSINYSAIPMLNPANYSGVTGTTRTLRYLERPWMLHIFEWPSRDAHPYLNMEQYHENISREISDAMLVMLMDTPERNEIIRRFVQVGIDYYQVGLHGAGDGSYFKGPVIAAGHLLGDTAMKNAFINNSLSAVPRDEPDFYMLANQPANCTTTSSIVPAGCTYHDLNPATCYNVAFRNNTAANRCYEHLDPSEWGPDASADNSYRVCCDSYPWIGQVLSVQIMGLVTEWDNIASFWYTQRWVDGEGWGTGKPSGGSPGSSNVFWQDVWDDQWVELQ